MPMQETEKEGDLIMEKYNNEYYRALVNNKINGLKINYLNPREEALWAIIGWQEELNGYVDGILYSSFIRDRRNWSKIQEMKIWHIQNYVEPFLSRWGYMDQPLRMKYAGWQDELLKVIHRNIGEKIQSYNDFILKDVSKEELKREEKNISSIFDKLRPIFGQTCSAKFLHLLIPDFFPLWDAVIRTNTRRAYKKTYNDKMPSDDGSGSFYFKFMNVQLDFIKMYNKELDEISKYFKKPLLRITDRYFWILSNEASNFINYE